MEQTIKKIDEAISAMTLVREQMVLAEEEHYKQIKHKNFEIGSYVIESDGSGRVGRVLWIDSEGYMGVSFLNGTCGAGKVRRNNWEMFRNHDYMSTKQSFNLVLTGEEIQLLLYTIGPRGINENSAKLKVIETIEKLKIDLSVDI